MDVVRLLFLARSVGDRASVWDQSSSYCPGLGLPLILCMKPVHTWAAMKRYLLVVPRIEV